MGPTDGQSASAAESAETATEEHEAEDRQAENRWLEVIWPHWIRPHVQPRSLLMSPLRRWRMRTERTGPGRRRDGGRGRPPHRWN